MSRPHQPAAVRVARRPWLDDAGALLSGAWLLVAGLLVLGAAPVLFAVSQNQGRQPPAPQAQRPAPEVQRPAPETQRPALEAPRQALDAQLTEFGNVLLSLDPSYVICGNELRFNRSPYLPVAYDPLPGQVGRRFHRGRIDEFDVPPESLSPGRGPIAPAGFEQRRRGQLTPAASGDPRRADTRNGARDWDRWSRRRDPRDAIAWTAGSGYLRGTHTPDGRVWSTKDRIMHLEPFQPDTRLEGAPLRPGEKVPDLDH